MKSLLKAVGFALAGIGIYFYAESFIRHKELMESNPLEHKLFMEKYTPPNYNSLMNFYDLESEENSLRDYIEKWKEIENSLTMPGAIAFVSGLGFFMAGNWEEKDKTDKTRYWNRSKEQFYKIK